MLSVQEVYNVHNVSLNLNAAHLIFHGHFSFLIYNFESIRRNGSEQKKKRYFERTLGKRGVCMEWIHTTEKGKKIHKFNDMLLP